MKKYLFSLSMIIVAIALSQCGKETPAPTEDITVTTSDFSTTIAENPAAAMVLGSVSGSTSSGSVTYSIETESVAGAMAINSSSGELTVADAALYDFETNPTITGTVKVSNGSVSKTANVTITLTDVDEAPAVTVTTADFSASIAENPQAGAVIGTVTGSTSSGAVTFTLLTESVAGALSITSNSGELSVSNPDVFDFENNPSITATVEVANGDVKEISNITITVTDVDDNIIWTGAPMTFTKADNTDPTMEANQDRITDKVWLTRAIDEGALYNAVTETKANSTSPAGTLWAEGTTADLANLTFTTLRQVDNPKKLVNRNLVLKLTEENIYIDLKITSWPDGNNGANGGSGGGFTYERSTAN